MTPSQVLSILCVPSGSLSILYPRWEDARWEQGGTYLDRPWLGRLAGPGHSKGTLSRTGLPGRQDASLTLCGLVTSHQDGEEVRRPGWGRHIGQGQETREGGLEWTALTKDVAWGSSLVRILWGQQPPIALVLPPSRGQAGVIPPHSIASTKRVKMALLAHSSLISLAITETQCVCVVCVCV